MSHSTVNDLRASSKTSTLNAIEIYAFSIIRTRQDDVCLRILPIKFKCENTMQNESKFIDR